MNDTRWKNYALIMAAGSTYRATSVNELLQVAGQQRAGARIVEGIERDLAAHKIGHFPPRIPRDQNAQVLLYNQDAGGFGAALHLVRQLAEGVAPAGVTTNDQVEMLARLLDDYLRAPTEEAASA